MAEIDFTLNDIRGIVREEIAPLRTEVKADISDLRSEVAEVRSEVADVRSEVAEVRSEVAEVRSEVAEVRSEVAEVRSEVAEVRSELETGLNRVSDRIENVRVMLEEDFMAEAERVSRLERRLTQTRTELRRHIADSAAHT